MSVSSLTGRTCHALVVLGMAGLIGFTTPAAAAAQETEEGAPDLPAGWEVRTDRGQPAAEVAFEEMAPGWHVTTGPAAILWRPGTTASGSYRAEAEVFLFDPGDRREGYGILVGGTDLRGEDQAYTYFLLRRDGRYLVKRRDGSDTSVLRDWTEHPAVVAWEERDEGAETVRNVLAVEAGPDEVAFLVNGEEVHRLPREGLQLDGVVGLRVNHGLNLHVSRLEVQPLGGG